MIGSAIGRMKLALGFCAAVVALCLAIATTSVPGAQAYTVSNYCNGITQVSYELCIGAYRTVYAVEGWGDQHSVCVWFQTTTEVGRQCSGGPGAHIYDPWGGSIYAGPGIQNNAAGSNTVHGRAYQP